MKWIFALLLLVSATALGQIGQGDDSTKYIRYQNQYGMRMPRGWFDSVLHIPYYDTARFKPQKAGAIMMHLDKNVYKWNGGGWEVLGGAPLSLTNVGSGYRLVTTPNGSIKTLIYGYGLNADSTSMANTITVQADTSETNHLVTQSDLNDGLVTKLNISDTTNKWINDIRRSNDSVYAFKNGSWQFKYMDSTGSGGGQNLRSDLGPLSETKIYTPASGVASSSNVTNYSHTSLDSTRGYFTTTRIGTSGAKYGGWLAASTSGDSIQVTAPFWVVIGDSQAEGHPGLHGRLHTLPSGAYQYNYPDSVGQLSYHLRYLTNMRWYNHGIGGQTTEQVRARFYRDVLARDFPGATLTTTKTLSRRPQGVVIIAGINDIFNGIPVQTTKENLEWMASVCQQYGIRCVILNLPGDAISGQTELKKIAEVNTWLAGGVMDQYGACVVDYNSWWNDPTYGNDNIHHTALITDDIHPSKVGYDSLANYIYRQARLPVLTKALFINELDPGGFTGYSRPAGITINTSPYTISSSTQLINISTYVPDSVWIKVTSSTNVTGTSYSGFGHIEWFVDNNPNDSVYYTKRTQYSGSVTANQNVSSIKVVDPINRTSSDNFPTIDVRLNDTTNRALQVYTNGAGGYMILNGLTNTSVVNNAVLSVYGGIGTTSNVLANGGAHQFGDLEIKNNSSPTNTGFGISTANTASGIRLASTAIGGRDLIRLDSWSGGGSGLSTNPTNLLAITNTGFNNSGGEDQVANAISITPTYNHTSTTNGGIQIRGIYYNPTLTALGNARHVGLGIETGNNYFNSTSDSTCFGCSMGSIINSKFRVNGSVKFDLGSDATGDIYYRNSSGLFTRLGVGSNGDVLTLASGVPSWAAPDGILKGSTSWTPGVVAAGSSASTTVTVTGAATTDVVHVNKVTGGISNGEIYDAYVSSANTVTIRVHNVSTGSANYSSSETYNVIVHKY